jgi:hypothetical protein
MRESRYELFHSITALMVITTSIIMVTASAIPRLRYSPDVEDEVCTSVSFIVGSVSAGVRDDGKVFLYPRVGSCYTASFVVTCTNAHAFNVLDCLAIASHLIVAPLGRGILKYYPVRDLNIRSWHVLRACDLSLRMKERKSRDKKYYLEHYLFMQK